VVQVVVVHDIPAREMTMAHSQQVRVQPTKAMLVVLLVTTEVQDKVVAVVVPVVQVALTRVTTVEQGELA
jgi:hypothetical protein